MFGHFLCGKIWKQISRFNASNATQSTRRNPFLTSPGGSESVSPGPITSCPWQAAIVWWPTPLWSWNIVNWKMVILHSYVRLPEGYMFETKRVFDLFCGKRQYQPTIRIQKTTHPNHDEYGNFVGLYNCHSVWRKNWESTSKKRQWTGINRHRDAPRVVSKEH